MHSKHLTTVVNVYSDLALIDESSLQAKDTAQVMLYKAKNGLIEHVKTWFYLRGTYTKQSAA